MIHETNRTFCRWCNTPLLAAGKPVGYCSRRCAEERLGEVLGVDHDRREHRDDLPAKCGHCEGGEE